MLIDAPWNIFWRYDTFSELLKIQQLLDCMWTCLVESPVGDGRSRWRWASQGTNGVSGSELMLHHRTHGQRTMALINIEKFKVRGTLSSFSINVFRTSPVFVPPPHISTHDHCPFIILPQRFSFKILLLQYVILRFLQFRCTAFVDSSLNVFTWIF